jgi:4-hydroxy-tetrahydrodipicolinate synthase
VVCGTTGESPVLSEDEKLSMFRTVVEAVGGRASVVAGTGTYDTAESIRLSRAAQELGCDAVMAVTPYYSKPPQEGLYRHFTAIADAVEVPLMVYNIPGRTARLIEVETLARLSEHPRIVATKDAVEDVAFTKDTVAARRGELAIYSGADAYTVPMMKEGGVGVVSVVSHVAGDVVAAMVAAAAKQDYAEADRLQEGLLPLIDALFSEPSPMPVRAALNDLWQPVGEPRLPLVPASEETLARTKEALAAVQAL